jgi:Domain of unknown function (DUF4136)
MKSPWIKVASLLLGLATFFAGCSTPTRVDTGPIKATTFSFVARAPQTTPTFADNDESLHAMIQNAISRNLESKGLKHVPSGGDVIVAYLVIVGNNVSTMAINEYFGYGRDAYALQDKAHEAYSSGRNPDYFEAGTLLIDIMDAKTYQLLKRSFVVRPLLRNAAPDVRAARVQKAVDAVLQNLRVAP